MLGTRLSFSVNDPLLVPSGLGVTCDHFPIYHFFSDFSPFSFRKGFFRNGWSPGVWGDVDWKRRQTVVERGFVSRVSMDIRETLSLVSTQKSLEDSYERDSSFGLRDPRKTLSLPVTFTSNPLFPVTRGYANLLSKTSVRITQFSTNLEISVQEI